MIHHVYKIRFAILINVPKQIRSQRVRDRSYQKFGDRILPGGDLYDKREQVVFADGTGMCMEGWTKRAVDWFESL